MSLLEMQASQKKAVTWDKSTIIAKPAKEGTKARHVNTDCGKYGGGKSSKPIVPVDRQQIHKDASCSQSSSATRGRPVTATLPTASVRAVLRSDPKTFKTAAVSFVVKKPDDPRRHEPRQFLTTCDGHQKECAATKHVARSSATIVEANYCSTKGGRVERSSKGACTIRNSPDSNKPKFFLPTSTVSAKSVDFTTSRLRAVAIKQKSDEATHVPPSRLAVPIAHNWDSTSSTTAIPDNQSSTKLYSEAGAKSPKWEFRLKQNEQQQLEKQVADAEQHKKRLSLTCCLKTFLLKQLTMIDAKIDRLTKRLHELEHGEARSKQLPHHQQPVLRQTPQQMMLQPHPGHWQPRRAKILQPQQLQQASNKQKTATLDMIVTSRNSRSMQSQSDEQHLAQREPENFGGSQAIQHLEQSTYTSFCGKRASISKPLLHRPSVRCSTHFEVISTGQLMQDRKHHASPCSSSTSSAPSLPVPGAANQAAVLSTVVEGSVQKATRPPETMLHEVIRSQCDEAKSCEGTAASATIKPGNLPRFPWTKTVQPQMDSACNRVAQCVKSAISSTVLLRPLGSCASRAVLREKRRLSSPKPDRLPRSATATSDVQFFSKWY